jgi:hypothetical protein
MYVYTCAYTCTCVYVHMYVCLYLFVLVYICSCSLLNDTLNELLLYSVYCVDEIM